MIIPSNTPSPCFRPTGCLSGLTAASTIVAEPVRTAEDVKRRMPHDVLYRVAFVPYAFAEIAWDYTETFCDLSAISRIPELKEVIRTIRQLRSDYESRTRLEFRSPRYSREHFMVRFQEIHSPEFSRLHSEVSQELTSFRPGLDPELSLLPVCVMMVMAILDAVILYQSRVSTPLIERYCGIACRGILPTHIVTLRQVVPVLCGDALVDDSPARRRFRDWLMREMSAFEEPLNEHDFRIAVDGHPSDAQFARLCDRYLFYLPYHVGSKVRIYDHVYWITEILPQRDGYLKIVANPARTDGLRSRLRRVLTNVSGHDIHLLSY